MKKLNYLLKGHFDSSDLHILGTETRKKAKRKVIGKRTGKVDRIYFTSRYFPSTSIRNKTFT